MPAFKKKSLQNAETKIIWEWKNRPTVKDITMEKYGVEEAVQMGFKKCHGFILQAFRKAVNLKA